VEDIERGVEVFFIEDLMFAGDDLDGWVTCVSGED
jgi:hypothetical protein